MGQFYVTVYVSNSRFAQIAIEAMLDRAPITMNGEFDEEARTVTGFVQSIEAAANAMPRRWRITILEDDRHSDRVVSFPRRSRDATRQHVERNKLANAEIAVPMEADAYHLQAPLPAPAPVGLRGFGGGGLI
jgi:phytoene dehydrogenase-like protein